jgi:hypothetical protein
MRGRETPKEFPDAPAKLVPELKLRVSDNLSVFRRIVVLGENLDSRKTLGYSVECYAFGKNLVLALWGEPLLKAY